MVQLLPGLLKMRSFRSKVRKDKEIDAPKTEEVKSTLSTCKTPGHPQSRQKPMQNQYYTNVQRVQCQTQPGLKVYENSMQEHHNSIWIFPPPPSQIQESNVNEVRTGISNSRFL